MLDFARFPEKHAVARARSVLAFLAILITTIAPAAAFASPPTFSPDMALASDSGQVDVQWQADGEVTLTMNETSRGTKLVYKGTDSRIFLSGLRDGDYELRLASEDGALSEPAVVEVRHQSLSRALFLVLIGALVTLGIVIVVLRGARHG